VQRLAWHTSKKIGERGPEGFLGNLQPNAEQFTLHCRNSQPGTTSARLHVLFDDGAFSRNPATVLVQTIATLCQNRSSLTGVLWDRISYSYCASLGVATSNKMPVGLSEAKRLAAIFQVFLCSIVIP
jgi:hypothetical protein